MPQKVHYHMPSLEKTKLDEKLYLHRIVGKEMAIVYAEFQKGAVHNNLTHSNEEFFYLISGEMHAEIDNQSYTLKNGEGVLIPANVLHSFSANETSIALITFAPPITHDMADKILEESKSKK